MRVGHQHRCADAGRDVPPMPILQHDQRHHPPPSAPGGLGRGGGEAVLRRASECDERAPGNAPSAGSPCCGTVRGPRRRQPLGEDHLQGSGSADPGGRHSSYSLRMRSCAVSCSSQQRTTQAGTPKLTRASCHFTPKATAGAWLAARCRGRGGDATAGWLGKAANAAGSARRHGPAFAGIATALELAPCEPLAGSARPPTQPAR